VTTLVAVTTLVVNAVLDAVRTTVLVVRTTDVRVPGTAIVVVLVSEVTAVLVIIVVEVTITVPVPGGGEVIGTDVVLDGTAPQDPKAGWHAPLQ